MQNLRAAFPKLIFLAPDKLFEGIVISTHFSNIVTSHSVFPLWFVEGILKAVHGRL